jgi:predicted metal-dependent hydrolase
MEQMEYRLIRSSRRTIGLEITPDGLLVRAPYGVSAAQIEQFLREKADWIASHREKLRQRTALAAAQPKLTAEELQALAEEALRVSPERVRQYAPLVGVTVHGITIRNQRTRWGSCSSKGNLNFNCLLMLTPVEVIDSVVVHELCHRLEMNHSPRFYAEVRRVFPDYDKWSRWLKDNGPAIMARMN